MRRRFVDEREFEAVFVEHLAQLLVAGYRRRDHPSKNDERPARTGDSLPGANDHSMEGCDRDQSNASTASTL